MRTIITRPAPVHLTCHQCGYEWDSRLKDGQLPKKCPYCQSWYWDVPRPVAGEKGK